MTLYFIFIAAYLKFSMDCKACVARSSFIRNSIQPELWNSFTGWLQRHGKQFILYRLLLAQFDSKIVIIYRVATQNSN